MIFVRSTLIAVSVIIVIMTFIGLAQPNKIPATRLIASSYEQDLLRWEVNHFLGKWVHLARAKVSPTPPSRQENLRAVSDFFALSRVVRDLESSIEQKIAEGLMPRSELETLSRIRLARSKSQPVVEETLEAAISETLSILEIPGRIGPLRWPPVDFTFEDGALVLITSPRNEIKRIDQIVMTPGIDIENRSALEAEIETINPDLTAVVVAIGGLATYPAQVHPGKSLVNTLEIAAHEWLHHWLVFRPLGRAWFDGGELMAINETAANLFGREVGLQTYGSLLGSHVSSPKQHSSSPLTVQAQEQPFNFTQQMRLTRLKLESLLSGDRVREAEAYLESRRLVFVAHGYPIRKLNTAWFAFHGSYGDGGASASPIADQLKHVRKQAGSVAGFLEAISSIEKEGDLATIAIRTGWVPKSD